MAWLCFIAEVFLFYATSKISLRLISVLVFKTSIRVAELVFENV